MTPDKPFDLAVGAVIPPSLRSSLNRMLKSTTRLIVSELADGKKEKRNGLKITNTPGGYPRESLEEIVAAIAAMMHVAWLDQETIDPEVGPPPMEFVVTAEHYDSNNKRKRTEFTVTYHGGEGGYDDVADESFTLEERTQQRCVESLERQLAIANDTLERANDMLLRLIEKQSQAMSSQGEAASATMQQAIPMFFGGVQSMLNAKFMEYDRGAAEAKEKATTERLMGTLRTVAPFLAMGAAQIIAHKSGVPREAIMGMIAPLLGALGGSGVPTEAAAAPASEPASTSAEDSTSIADDERPPEHLLAAFASGLGESLSNTQRRELAKRFKPAQLQALDDLFCAETDDEAAAAYDAVVKKAGAELLKLQELLSEEQRGTLAYFMQAMAQYKAARAVPPA